MSVCAASGNEASIFSLPISFKIEQAGAKKRKAHDAQMRSIIPRTRCGQAVESSYVTQHRDRRSKASWRWLVTRADSTTGLGTPLKTSNDARRYTMTTAQLFVLVSLRFDGFGALRCVPQPSLRTRRAADERLLWLRRFWKVRNGVAEAAPHVGAPRSLRGFQECHRQGRHYQEL